MDRKDVLVTLQGLQRTFAATLQLLPAARRGRFSCRAFVLSAALPSAQHKKTQHRERSRTAVRTLQVYLTRFRREDLIFGETDHQAAAAGSCAHRTEQDSPCDPPDGTSPVGLLHMLGLGRTCSNPPRSSCVLHRPCSSLCPHREPALVSTKGWRALAKAGITLAKLPGLQQQEGSQSCSSSGLSQVSPAFSEQVSAGFLRYPTQI